MSQSVLALYLSHVEASFAFDDSSVVGAVFDDNRVASLTPNAQARGLTLGMDRRTAQAFVTELQCTLSNPETVHAWIDRVTHFVSQTQTPLHVVFDPLNADSLLICLPWQGDFASAIATFEDMSPSNLRLGLGPSERIAFVAALTQKEGLTESTFATTPIMHCLPSESIDPTATLRDLIEKQDHFTSDVVQNLRAALLGDWYDDAWIDPSKELTLTWALHETTPHLEHQHAAFEQMAHSVSVWMQNHHKATLGLTVTLQGKTQKTAFTLDLTDATSESILKVALDTLTHQTFGEAIQTMKVEHTHAVQVPQKPIPGSLAERLQSRFGERRVFMLSSHEHALPEATQHRDPVPDGHTQRPLMVHDAMEPSRPVFLLKTPIELHTHHGEVYWEGVPIVGMSAPTQYRDQNVIRDYCVAHASDGRRLWIYRQKDDQSTLERWYLHGFFA